jgi:hypothetical protein
VRARRPGLTTARGSRRRTPGATVRARRRRPEAARRSNSGSSSAVRWPRLLAAGHMTRWRPLGLACCWTCCPKCGSAELLALRWDSIDVVTLDRCGYWPDLEPPKNGKGRTARLWQHHFDVAASLVADALAREGRAARLAVPAPPVGEEVGRPGRPPRDRGRRDLRLGLDVPLDPPPRRRRGTSPRKRRRRARGTPQEGAEVARARPAQHDAGHLRPRARGGRREVPGGDPPPSGQKAA